MTLWSCTHAHLYSLDYKLELIGLSVWIVAEVYFGDVARGPNPSAVDRMRAYWWTPSINAVNANKLRAHHPALEGLLIPWETLLAMYAAERGYELADAEDWLVDEIFERAEQEREKGNVLA
jgi:hypothetical protein